MFSYIGIGINFLLILLLASKKGKTSADKILLSWLILIATHLALFALSQEPITTKNVHWLLGTGIPFPLLHGPMLFLYTAASTNLLPRNRRLLLLHFAPALVAVLLFLPVLLKNADEKIVFIANGAQGYQTADFLRIILLQVSGFVYFFWSLLLLNKHKRIISQEFSYQERINLNWLRYFIYGLGTIWIIVVFTRNDYYIFVGVVVFIIFLGYFGIRQVGIFTPDNLYKEKGDSKAVPANSVESEGTGQSHDISPEYTVLDIDTSNRVALTNEVGDVHSIKPVQRKKYASSGVTIEMGNDIHHRLIQLMATAKLFTEPELSLSMLAKKMQVHPNYLSQVINEKEGKTFFEYINELRVEEFKRLVAMPKNRQFTIMSLAYECGFNSKSSFNTNFKKVTGQAPSEYLAASRDNKDANPL